MKSEAKAAEPAGRAHARKMRRALLVAGAGGALAGLCWLPFALAPLFPVAFFLMSVSIRPARNYRDALRIGLVFASMRYVVASHFLLALLRYSPLAVVFYLLAIAWILPFGAAEGCGGLWLERRTGLPRGVGMALLYALGDYLRAAGDLSFPADSLAHAFGLAPAFLAWSPVIGPYGVSLTLTTSGALLERAFAWGPRRPAGALALVTALALWTGPPLTALLAPPAPPDAASTLRIGIVQPAIPIERKIKPEHAPGVWSDLKRLTREAAQGTDLVVWPESARPGYLFLRGGRPEDPEMAAIAAEVGKPILYGAHIAEVEEKTVLALYNGAALVDPSRGVMDWYGKQRLLPFVEGVPFGKHFGWDPRDQARRGLRKGYLGMLGNFSRGPRPTVFEVGEARLGVLICYEGFYPQLGRAYAREGANALVVLTNDIWWGHSAFAPWHAQMIAARAREFGVPAVRAANSGVSSLTDRSGRLLARSRLGEVTTMKVDLETAPPRQTFYARHGDFVLWLVAIIPLGLLVARRALRRR